MDFLVKLLFYPKWGKRVNLEAKSKLFTFFLNMFPRSFLRLRLIKDIKNRANMTVLDFTKKIITKMGSLWIILG